MAKREINIVLRAKNAMAAGIAQAGESLKNFGESAARIGKAFAKAFLAAGAAVAGFAAKALHAYAGLERSTSGLAASIDSFGESSQAAIPALRNQAKAIQDQTGQTHMQTFAIMNLLKLQGMQTDQLAAGTKGVIALTRAGMSEEAATRAMTAATMGNFQALTRYIPELRVATDESEKARIVNEFLNRGYAAQQDELQTLSGQWNNLKGRIGDAWESMGSAIAQTGGLTTIVEKASDAVKRFVERIDKWAAGGGMHNLLAMFEHAFENIRYGFRRSSNSSHIAFASIGDGFATVGKYLGNIGEAITDNISNQFRAMARVVSATIEFIKKPSREGFRAIGTAAKDAAKSVIDAHVNLARAIATNTGIVNERTEAALAARAELEKDHAARVEAIAARQTARLNAMQDKRKKTHIEALNAIDEAEVARLGKQEQLEKAKQDAIKRVAALEKKAAAKEKAARDKALQEEIARLERVQRERQELAQKRVADLINEAQQDRDDDREKSRESWRAQELKARMARGAKLSRRQQEWLEAFRTIDAARQGADPKDPLMQQLAVARDNLEQLRRDGRTLNDILREIQDEARTLAAIERDLADNLKMA